MNWKCDVYVYESTYGGFTTHVAARRRIIPPIPNVHIRFNSKRPALINKLIYSFATFWYNNVHMMSLRFIPLRPIGLPHDGENFCDETPSECADRLEKLRAIGYNVPQYAIDALREEAKE